MKRFFHTLEAKFISLAMVIVLASSIAINYYFYTGEKIRHFSESEKRARLLSESTAISFTNTLLYEEIGLVEEGGLLENQISDLIKNRDTEIIEMVVLSPVGLPLAASDYTWYDDSFVSRGISQLIKTSQNRISHTTRNNIRALEVVVPLHIYGKRFGTLVAYFSMEKEYEFLAAWRRQLFLLTILGLVGALGVAYIVARILATPIKRLAQEMVKVSNPYYRSKMVSTRRDEIGLLEKRFLNMMDRLQQAAIEKEQSQQALIQTEKMAAIGTLAAGLAHEINNPLAGTENCLRRIEANPENVSQTKKYVALMKNALTRIENLVQGLLQFSRNQKTVFQPLDINSVIIQAFELLEYKIKKSNISFESKLMLSPPSILGDREQLEQVFINLILNAIDALPKGGKLSIKTVLENGSVSAIIRDDGIGIPKSNIHKIFDPFFTTKDLDSGTGLGLAVCKNIVESHNGEIEVERTDERGTALTVSFPAMKETFEGKIGVCGAILAGGKALRMGMDKALLKFNGKTLIERTIDVISLYVVNPMIIANNLERYSVLELPVYKDIIQDIGPLGGVYTALKHCKSTHCLVLACDLPFLSLDLIKLLVEQGTAYDVLVVDSKNGLEPLCAVYSKSCIMPIEQQINAGNVRVIDFYKSVNTKIIYLEQIDRVFSPHLFFNVNTPEDLKEAEKMNANRGILK